MISSTCSQSIGQIKLWNSGQGVMKFTGEKEMFFLLFIAKYSPRGIFLKKNKSLISLFLLF